MKNRGPDVIGARRRPRYRWAWLALAGVLGGGADCWRLGQAAENAPSDALLEIHSVVVDGTPASLPPGEKLRLHSHPRTVTFGFGPGTNPTRQPIRLRFKLDGYDEGWREYNGSMRLCVRFLDHTGDQVGETVFRVAGQSAGWTGDPKTSAFTPRRETIVVPPRATSFWVVMSSAGPPATVGVYAITNLVIRSQPPNAAAPAVLLPWAFAAGSAMAAGGAPEGWMRDGLRPSMAGVFESGSAPRTKGLVIVDDDLDGHAEWHTIKEMAIAVTPGDRLLIEWNEAYSFSLAQRVEMAYRDLPAGYYRFRLNALSVMGIPGEAETSLAIEVPLAFWLTPWFWVSVVTMVLAAGAGGWRYVVWHRRQLELRLLEQHLALGRERLRIAQDIHDDLGARVTQIALLSAVAQGKMFWPEEARTEFGKVSQMTRELVSALYETVWAVNPENDNLDALANYLCQMSNQYCLEARLRCRLEIPEALPGILLTSQVRHNLTMAVKEAIHNVVKHARATEVRLRISCEASVLAIFIQDNGCGFKTVAHPPGNGLGNLRDRLEHIGGSFSVESRLGTGTTVSLRLPVAKGSSLGVELPAFGDGRGPGGGAS